VFPEHEHQYGEFTRDGDDGLLLGGLTSSCGEHQAVAAQVAVLSKGAEEVLGGSYEQLSQVCERSFTMLPNLAVQTLQRSHPESSKLFHLNGK
jgi:hypothetical protein